MRRVEITLQGVLRVEAEDATEAEDHVREWVRRWTEAHGRLLGLVDGENAIPGPGLPGGVLVGSDELREVHGVGVLVEDQGEAETHALEPDKATATMGVTEPA